MSTSMLLKVPRLNVVEDNGWFEIPNRQVRARLSLVRRTESFVSEEPSEFKRAQFKPFIDDSPDF